MLDNDPTILTYRASIMPTRIFQDGSIRTVFTSNLDPFMIAVQAILTTWMAEGKMVEVQVRVVEPVFQKGSEDGKVSTRTVRKSKRAAA